MTDTGSPEAPNPYEPPRANLEAGVSLSGLSPYVQDAIAGRYAFKIADVMGEAWDLVHGMKATFWGAAVIIGSIYLLFLALAGWIVDPSANAFVKQASQGLVGALMTPLTMGLQMMCVRRALGQPISFGTAFSYFSRTGTALAAAMLVFAYLCAGALAFFIPSIYLGVAYQFVTQLVGDGLTASDAMTTSRMAVKHRWWSVLGLILIVGLIMCVSALGLLIPLIWTIPWAMMTTAVLYRRIFYAALSPGPVATR